MKRAWAFLLGWLLLVPAAAQAQFTYTTNGGTITITGYTGPGGAVTIPSTINGLPVTTIGITAFFGLGSLTSVTIPNSVTTLAYQAFGDCYGLTSITIPNSVTSISQPFIECSGLTNVTIGSGVTSLGYWEFAFCTSLSNITIPSGVTNIDDTAFYTCTSLSTITVDTLNPYYSSLGGVMFNKSQTTLIKYPVGKSGSYTIPNGVTNIGELAFSYCTNLTGITLPNTVENIGTNSFYDCANLASVTIPDSVTNIQYGAFQGCGLTNVTFGSGVIGIGEYAFSSCANLTSITIPNSVTTIAASTFEDCIGLASITIPNSVTTIGYDAFYDCSSLIGVTIPNSVTNIGNQAFESCAGLNYLSLSPSVSYIGTNAFGFCTGLTSLAVPSGVSYIALGAFSGCTGLTEVTVDPLNPYYSSLGGVLFNKSQTVLIQYPPTRVGSYTIPNSVISIESLAFRFCQGLTDISIPNSVAFIGENAFGHCFGLTSVTIPSSVSAISTYTFDDCTGLTNVTLPNSVTSIGPGAFDFCTSLTHMTIPAGVATIGDEAFAGSYDLAGLYFLGNPPSAGSGIFFSDTNTTVYYLATGRTTGWGATYGGRPAVALNAIVFTANPTNGLVPLTVSFAAAGVDSAGNPVISWDWTFGDGSTSTDQNPAHTYTNAGTFSTALIAANSIGSTVLGLGPASITANAIGQTQFTFTTNAHNITITGYIGSGGAVAIPSTINGLPVIAIAGLAFADNTNISTVTIPNSVSIIGPGAFEDCSALLAITVDTLDSAYTSVDGVLFDKSQATLIQFPGAKGGSYTVPNTITTIGDDAFGYCSQLTSVTIPNTVNSIGGSAFEYCTNLIQLYFQGNAPSLGDSNVFSGDINATVYYIAGTSGWGPTYGGRPTVRTGTPPVILTPPSNETASLQETVDFTVVAAGSPPLNYQWFFNNSAISGASSSDLQLINVGVGQAGTYNVVVTNDFGAVTSPPVTLSVNSAATYRVLHYFTGVDGSEPMGSLALDGTTLYGTAYYGGYYPTSLSGGEGTLFKLNVDGSGFGVLELFNGSTGCGPGGNLVISGTNLYGTTAFCGNFNHGTVFKIGLDGSGYTVLKQFTGNDGSTPFGGLVMSGSVLYGTTYYGGSYYGGTSNLGTVFKINTDGSGFTVLKNFTGSDGSNPYAAPVVSGTTIYGTAGGVVFKLNTDGTGFSVLKSFSASEGAAGSLLLADSTLYGTTGFGGPGATNFGTVFKLNTDGSNFRVLKSFGGGDDGAIPDGLVLSGMTLYGTTSGGGLSWDGNWYSGKGLFFQLDTNGNGYSVLKQFNGSDGAEPGGQPLLSGTTFYGMTLSGGISNNGVVFTLSLVVPNASDITAATVQNQPLNLMVAKLLALASDPNGGSVSVTSVSATSTNGGSVVLGPNQITYIPVAGYLGADRFTYTLSDATGASASAYVFVQVLATNQISANMLPLSTISGGYLVSFAGIPGRTYSVQRASAVTGPWATIATATAGLDGIGAIQDTNSPPGTAFYRTTYP